ncbi:hypothetical protein H477_3883 [[Clostridium] sordellii ATCC 9714]|nr:hypothetical protein H477_3883 [[Clostridium] sordellii ATCC 9714] [Paeniclostridium sordellii ATCC 9714]
MSELKNKLANKATGTTTVKKPSPNKAMEQLMTQMAGQIKKHYQNTCQVKDFKGLH